MAHDTHLFVPYSHLTYPMDMLVTCWLIYMAHPSYSTSVLSYTYPTSAPLLLACNVPE